MKSTLHASRTLVQTCVAITLQLMAAHTINSMHCRIANPPPPTSFPARDVSAQGGTTPQEVEQVVSYLWNWIPRICTRTHWLLPIMHTAHLMSTSSWGSQSCHSVLDLPNQHAHHLPHRSLSFLSSCNGVTMIITPCRRSGFSCSGRSTRSENNQGSRAIA